jgi:hypothetical protein
LNLYDKPRGVETRWFSPENPTGARGQGGQTNGGAKGRPFVSLPQGERHTLVDTTGSGIIRRIWITINDRSPEMLRGLRIEMTWDGAETPAVSAPFGDFFGIALGRRVPFECALFSDPEGRSFNAFIPMPFRHSARIELINDSGRDLPYLFYDVDATVGENHAEDVLYFHTSYRRENPNVLGHEFAILPEIEGSGRFLGCNLGVAADPRYEGCWWGEGEVKIRLNGEEFPTLCGTGTEDYIGTAWGQGFYIQRTQGCSIADKENHQWAFYRYHVDDPVYFDGRVSVAIQTIGGTAREQVLRFLESGLPVVPVSYDLGPGHSMQHLMATDPPTDLRSIEGTDGWSNFYRQDDWSATAYYYLDKP